MSTNLTYCLENRVSQHMWVCENTAHCNAEKVTKMYFHPYECVDSGVSRISFRGGVQNFSGKVGEFAWREAPCSAWRSHAFARGVRGHAPPRKF